MVFDDVVEIVPDEDWGGRGNDEMFDVYDEFDSKPKKNKNNSNGNSNGKKNLVEVKHEGYTLEKALPRSGEKPSWARIGQRPLPFDDKTLVDMVKRHRKVKGTTVEADFKELTANQQGVVNRLLEDRKRKEKTKNAEWILYDVQRFGKWKWRTVDVKQIQVILKRVDKTMPLKNGEYTKNAFKNQYHDFEIIDLAEPTKNNDKKKDKKLKKSRSLDEMFGDVDDPLGLNMGMGIGPPPRNHGRNNSFNHNQNQDHHIHNNHFDNQMPRQSQQFNQMPPIPPPLQPPPGAFPNDPNAFGQFQPEPFQPQPQPFNQQHQHQPHSARQSLTNVHPFQPDPNVATMAQFEFPPAIDDQRWPHPHQNGRERERPRSLSRERRPSTRRQSIGVDTGKMRRLEDKIDDLTNQIGTLKALGSDSSDYGNESTWSHPSEGRSWTPPSSPRSHFSEHKARGSLERRQSSAGYDPRYPGRYRSHRYRDVEIEPASSYRTDRRTYSPQYRRDSNRPKLIHARTYDDYPSGSAAEPRFLPPAPQPPRPLQRRLTEFEDRDRYENRGYDDRRQSDFRDRDLRESRDRQDSRRYGESYEGRRRDSAFDGRRQSYVSGGGGGEYYR